MIKVANLQLISRERLSELLLSSSASKVAIIDVRDDDHIGGHIHGSQHVPTSSLDYRIPEIVRTLVDKEKVVFHCALCQQRGPSAALRYMRERDTKMKKGELEASYAPPDLEVRDGAVNTLPSSGQNQEIYVLDKGFVGWQEK